MSNKQRKGFTLIEMLIVVAIIGILASIVVIGIGPAQKKGRDSRRAADLREVQTALELYFNKYGVYPLSSADTDWAALTADLKGKDIGVTTVPVDPTASKSYKYGSEAQGLTYVLEATLDDPNSSLLVNSIKGTINGVSCDGANYCISL